MYSSKPKMTTWMNKLADVSKTRYLYSIASTKLPCNAGQADLRKPNSHGRNRVMPLDVGFDQARAVVTVVTGRA